MKPFKMTTDWLRENGYEGLVNKTLDCGCGLSDFAPCGAIYGQCEPAILYIDEQGDYFYDTPEPEIAPNEKFNLISHLKAIVEKIDNNQRLGQLDAAMVETAFARLRAWDEKIREKEIKEQS